jgi:SAM-dependent methyltransferase
MPGVACPERALNDIWRAFTSQGITDDLTIIEHLTFLLLVQDAGLLDDLKRNLQPDARGLRLLSFLDDVPRLLYQHWGLFPDEQELLARPINMPDDRLLEILGTLEYCLDELSPAVLLNHCLLFRLPDRLAGGRYPTPRHIARTMASLVNVGEGESLADLACGSGGLLVAAADERPHVVGIEISPNWQRIAWANAVLHDLSAPTIRTANSLTAFRADDPPAFDRILMNPPFGVPVDRTALRNPYLEQYGTRSETLLTAQALATLKPGGRMAVLLPAGALFTSSSGELNLRRALVKDYQLQAVIALNKDACQPYSTIPTFIILAEKRVQESDPPTAAVWFYRVLADGFTPGRKRDPDPEHNDLPLVEAAVQTRADDPDHRLSDADGNALLEVKRLRCKDQILGYRFTRRAEGTLRLRQLGSSVAPKATLLAELRNPEWVGYLLVRDGTVFTGMAEHVPIPLQLPDLQLRDGRYLLPDEYEAALISEEGSTTLLIDKRLHDLRPSVEGTTDRAACFVIDNEGHPVSALLTTETDVLPSLIRPSAIGALPLMLQNGEPAGHLVVSNAPTVSAVPLSATDNAQILLSGISTDEVLLWKQEDSELTWMEPFASVLAFKGDKRQMGLAVDIEGTWFGVQMSVDEIEAPTYDLQPSTYFPVEAAERERRTPAQLLGDIKTNQGELQRHIDYLLGMMESRPIEAIQLPPTVEEAAQPLGSLTGIQETIWERIQQYCEELPIDEANQRLVPVPFQLEQLRGDLPVADLERTLDMFERMGLVVPVTYEGAPCYRLVANRDLVEPEEAP